LQDALGSSESEPARPARSRSKRSRAAEVHNLSEKVLLPATIAILVSQKVEMGSLILMLKRLVQKRRSRINEKMKALQTLVPNSSKVHYKRPLLSRSILDSWPGFVSCRGNGS
jgi:hypothetical protein